MTYYHAIISPQNQTPTHYQQYRIPLQEDVFQIRRNRVISTAVDDSKPSKYFFAKSQFKIFTCCDVDEKVPLQSEAIIFSAHPMSSSCVHQRTGGNEFQTSTQSPRPETRCSDTIILMLFLNSRGWSCCSCRSLRHIDQYHWSLLRCA